MNYQKHYNLLIDKAKQRNWNKKNAPCYIEMHHVIPRCLGGGNESQNLVCLTYHEHCVAHQLLVKIYPENRKLIFAVARMYGSNSTTHSGRITRKKASWLREAHAKAMSELFKGKKKAPFSEEHKKNLSEAHKGYKASKESNEKRSKSLKGKIKSDEHLANISAALKGKTQKQEYIKKRTATRAKTYTVVSEETKEKMRTSRAKQIMKSRPICMFGVNYDSVKSAKEALSMSNTMIYRRLSFDKHKDCYYL